MLRIKKTTQILQEVLIFFSEREKYSRTKLPHFVAHFHSEFLKKEGFLPLPECLVIRNTLISGLLV